MAGEVDGVRRLRPDIRWLIQRVGRGKVSECTKPSQTCGGPKRPAKPLLVRCSSCIPAHLHS